MFIFLDIETTGIDKNDKICSIGIISLKNGIVELKYELINENKKITPSASSIHNITNEMIKDKVKFKDGEIYAFLDKHNNTDTVLIMHESKFSLEYLLRSGFKWIGKVIDTKRVVKHLIPESQIFSLQFLRYELKLYKREKAESVVCGINHKIVTHNALDDALIVKLLYEYLLDYATTDEMCELSLKNVLVEKLHFGKYTNRYIEDIVMNDRKYIEWLLKNVSDLDDDLKYTIKYYLREYL